MIHHGTNIRRLREAKGIKQDTIAERLNLSQQSISRYETLQIIDDDILLKFATALEVPVEIIKQLDSDLTTFIVKNNSFTNKNICTDNNTLSVITIFGDSENRNVINHPIDDVIKLGKEKELLFERLIEAEKERNKELYRELILLEQIREDIQEIKEFVKKHY